ncbi:hypothetical protein ZWY2020_005497 [Hordeum vulgare]|nr:hypothetical protein ZWY2020_005497 [Hordeum vulgare]
MVLFEILGRRRNYDAQLEEESREWFPKWVWDKYEQGDMESIMSAAAGIVEAGQEKAETMCKVALWDGCARELTHLLPPTPSHDLAALRFVGATATQGRVHFILRLQQEQTLGALRRSDNRKQQEGVESLGMSGMSAAVTATVSAICATVAVVITMAVIRRCRHVRKKMHKKIVTKIMEEISKRNRDHRAAPDDGAAADDMVIEIGPVEKFLHDILNEKPMRFSPSSWRPSLNYSTEPGPAASGGVQGGAPQPAVCGGEAAQDVHEQEGAGRVHGRDRHHRPDLPRAPRQALWLLLRPRH